MQGKCRACHISIHLTTGPWQNNISKAKFKHGAGKQNLAEDMWYNFKSQKMCIGNNKLKNLGVLHFKLKVYLLCHNVKLSTIAAKICLNSIIIKEIEIALQCVTEATSDVISNRANTGTESCWRSFTGGKWFSTNNIIKDQCHCLSKRSRCRTKWTICDL